MMPARNTRMAKTLGTLGRNFRKALKTWQPIPFDVKLLCVRVCERVLQTCNCRWQNLRVFLHPIRKYLEPCLLPSASSKSVT